MYYYILGIVIGSVLILIGLIFLLISLINNFNHKKKIKIIGLKSEIKINSDIKVWAKQTKNLFMASSYFQYGNNKIFEVDSILITSKALIVIEIKSIKGQIQGNAQDIAWTKIVGDNKFSIANPIIQNEKHIDHIVKMTSIKVPTISLIIFSNRCQHIDVKNTEPHIVVIRHSELFDTLDQIDHSLETKLSNYEVRTIYGVLKSYKTNSYVASKKIKSMFEKRNK